MIITEETSAHAAAIEALLDGAFGPKRRAKTVYRLRRNVDPVRDLCFVALDPDAAGYSIDNPRLMATIRYWPVMAADGTRTLMLGPIAVVADARDQGLGGKLIRASLQRARELGYASVILVGDAPYYNRFGFTRTPVLGLTLPGPVELDRFLGLELISGSLSGARGLLGRVPAAERSTRPAANPAAKVFDAMRLSFAKSPRRRAAR